MKKIFDFTKKNEPLDMSKVAVINVFGWPYYPAPANDN